MSSSSDRVLAPLQALSAQWREMAAEAEKQADHSNTEWMKERTLTMCADELEAAISATHVAVPRVAPNEETSGRPTHTLAEDLRFFANNIWGRENRTPWEDGLSKLLNKAADELDTVVARLRSQPIENKEDVDARMVTLGNTVDSLTASSLDATRCAVCGWQLVTLGKQGCWRGNCSQRPLPSRFYDPERVKAEYGEHAPTERDPYIPPGLTAKEQHLMDVYAELGVRWGDNIFAVIESLKSASPLQGPTPQDAHEEEDLSRGVDWGYPIVSSPPRRPEGDE